MTGSWKKIYCKATEVLYTDRTNFHPRNLEDSRDMSMVRWEPLRELTALQSDMNRLFNSAFAGPTASASQRWLPPMDLVETGEDYVLRADLPGLKLEDVKLEIEDTVLTVSGERKLETEAEGGGYHRIERAFGSFSRKLTLPKGVDERGRDGLRVDALGQRQLA